MKKFVKPAAFAVAIILVTLSMSAKASGGPHFWYSSITSPLSAESNFSIELNRAGDEEVIYAIIENPGRKNLSIVLSAPDGSTIDNFFTGRKLVKMNKRYNFTGADEGMYTITVTDGVHKIKKEVKLERITQRPVSKITIQ